MSEHNHPNQQVGSQYNADAINIHHHHGSLGAAPASEESVVRLREQLEQFKASTANAKPRKLRALVLGAEDLLVLVCGHDRYKSLVEAADEAVAVEADCERRLEEIGFTPFNRPAEREKDELRRKAKRAGKDLKTRIAGIEYRK